MAIYAFDTWEPVLPADGNYWVAENATVIGNVELKSGASVWYNCVIRGDHDALISIGENSNIQDATVIHVDAGRPCTVGRRLRRGCRL